MSVQGSDKVFYTILTGIGVLALGMVYGFGFVHGQNSTSAALSRQADAILRLEQQAVEQRMWLEGMIANIPRPDPKPPGQVSTNTNQTTVPAGTSATVPRSNSELSGRIVFIEGSPYPTYMSGGDSAK